MIEWQPVDGDLPSTDLPAGASQPARIPLGRLLIDAGFLTQAQLDDALYEGSQTGERLGEVVVRRGLASEDDVARALAQQWGLDYVERSSIWFDADALARLSREDAQRLEVMPTRVEDGRVVVAVAEPTEQRLAALRDVIGPETVVVVVPKTALDAGLRSNLLASRRARSESPIDEVAHPPPLADGSLWPPPPLPPQPSPQPEPTVEEEEPAAEEHVTAAEPPAPLAPIAELPMIRHAGDADAEAVVALANEARAMAERLAVQAAAVSAQAHQNESYEARIAALERQLTERTEQLAHVREQLEAVLKALAG